MIYLLDTNAVSDLMANNTKVDRRLQGLSSRDCPITSVIVVGELRYGIQIRPVGQKRTALEIAAARILPRLQIERVPVAAADRYAAIKCAARAAGVAIDENDAWIAATALEVGATVVTRDRDFTRIQGLLVEDWSV